MTESGGTPVDWRAVAAATTEGMGILDGETFVHATDRLAEIHGHADAGALVGESWHSLVAASDRDRLERDALSRVREHGQWRGEATGLRADGRSFHQELSIHRLEGGSLVWAVRESGVDSDLRNDLERYETLVETVEDGVYALDEELRFSFVNGALCEMFGLPADRLLGTPVTELFADETERTLADDLRERVVASDTSTGTIQATLPTPDGDRVLEARYRLYPEHDSEYRGSVGVIRDVTDRETRERELERQRDELSTLTRITELLLEMTHELVGTTSREAVERTVCERLAESDLYGAAWIGEREIGGDRVTVRTSAGGGRRALVADESVAEHGPASRAVHAGTVHVETIDPTDTEPWQEAALACGFRAVAAVPLCHQETDYGVLVVYAIRPDAFSERERRGFGVLGETVGFAINAIKRRQLLFADTVTELEFGVSGPETFLTRASAAHGCRITLDGYVGSGDRWVLYLDVDGAPLAQIADEVDDDPSIAGVRIVDREGQMQLEVAVTESSLLDVIASVGGRVQEATVSDGDGQVVLDVPVDADVHGIFEHLDDTFSSSTLLARRERDRRPERVQALGGLLGDLTDRQREALEAAFRAGYFEWPRASTAEEIAETLDVAPPTFHAHLRKAEAAVFASLFD